MGWKKNIRDYLEEQDDWHFPTFTPGGRMGGKRQDMRRWLQVPIKWVFRGNRHAAFAFMRQATALMGMLEQQMAFLNLRQGVLRRFVRPDVLIECDKRFGLRTVTITVPKAGVSEHVQDEDFGFLVAVSDSTGIHFYYAEKWDYSFKYSSPMYGYYTPIPDDYNFENIYRFINYTLLVRGRLLEPSSDFQSRAVDTSLDNYGMDRLKGADYYSVHGLVLYDSPGYGFISYDTSGIEGLKLYLRGSLDGYDADNINTGCKWASPVLMPWNKGKIIQAFTTFYGGENINVGDELPAGYRYTDALRLSDIRLGRYNAQGQGFARFVSIVRGGANRDYPQTSYDGPIVPIPIHNNVRRYVLLNWGGELYYRRHTAPVLFHLISIRKGRNNIRCIPFKAEYIADFFPEWLRQYLYIEPRPIESYHIVGNWAHVNEITGELVIHEVLYFSNQQSGDEYFSKTGLVGIPESEHRRRWGMCSFRIVLPAPIHDMTEEEEELAIVQGARVENMVTREQFLPLFDWLLQKNQDKVYIDSDYRSEYTLESLLPNPDEPPQILYCHYKTTDEEGDTITKIDYVDYEFDEVVSYGVSGTPYDIDNDEKTKIDRNNELVMGLYLFSRTFIPDQKTLFALGDTAYSWTRHFGGVAVTPAGMFPQAMTWPDIINEDARTRPDVTYAGNGLWCCVCERMGERVMSVHMGTPITTEQREAGWREIHLVDPEWAATEGNYIVHVRPLLVTEERVVLLAIVRNMVEGTPHYHVATYDGLPADDPPVNDAETTRLKFRGEVLLQQEDEAMSWDICVLNIRDEYAQLMLRYPTPPIADKAHSFNKTGMLSRLAFTPTGAYEGWV